MRGNAPSHIVMTNDRTKIVCMPAMTLLFINFQNGLSNSNLVVCQAYNSRHTALWEVYISDIAPCCRLASKIDLAANSLWWRLAQRRHRRRSQVEGLTNRGARSCASNTMDAGDDHDGEGTMTMTRDTNQSRA